MTDPGDKAKRTPAAGDLSDRQLGDFRLLRRLGRGAMADVYLAEQLALKRRVAVKVLKVELAEDRTYLKRFEREAQAAASLVHANIVQIYEVGHIDGLHFIAQEYIRGQNLQQWLGRHGPPDVPHALSIMRQVAAALAKAAEQGVVHRDIKPENIMLTRSGEVKVADFGLARVARREGEAVDLTQIGVTMGTPLYMSPEQVEGRPLDCRSDIYSFGVTCYQMLAGAPPFTGETALGVAVQHLKKEPPPLEDLRSDLPAALCRLIHKMLAKAPDDRCQSAREILRELRRIHMEEFHDEWPEDLPGWESTGLELPDDPRSQVTRQLAGLMKTAAMARSGRRIRRTFLAGTLGTFLLGAALAWFSTREPPLLAETQTRQSSVQRQPSALLQYLHASRIGTKEAWQSVIEFFPDKEHLCNRAKQQLARIYLSEGDHDRALLLFDELAIADEEERELRAFGLAGQYLVLTLRGEYREAAVVLDELWEVGFYLRDRQMRQLVESAFRINSSQLEARAALEMEQFWDNHFPDEE